MNGTTLHSTPNERINFWTVSLASGLSLAVGVALLFTSGHAAPVRAASVQHSEPVRAEPTKPFGYLYYLVGSEEQHDAFLAQPEHAGILSEEIRTYVLVLRTLQDEVTVAGTQRELTELGHSAEIIDLRGIGSAPLRAQQA